MKLKVEIEGMSCEHCAKRVENALSNLENVTSAHVDLNKKLADVDCSDNLDLELLKNTIEDLGYEVKNIVK